MACGVQSVAAECGSGYASGSIKMYGCHVCEAKFRSRCHLAYHKRGHRQLMSAKAAGARRVKSIVCAAAGDSTPKSWSALARLRLSSALSNGGEPSPPAPHVLSAMLAAVGPAGARGTPQKGSLLGVLQSTENSARRHACPHCDKSYTKRCNLDVHVRVQHTNERPFKCATCGRPFGRADHCRAHERTHGNAAPARCHCGLTFGTEAARRLHQARGHCGGYK